MFLAEIENKRHKTLWSKSVIALQAVAEGINFSVREDGVSLSAINLSRTSHGEIFFKRLFFSKYEVDFSNVMQDGFAPKTAITPSPSYSFLINSRHLATLFRNLDSNGLKYILLRVNWNKNASHTVKYKLLIEIKNKKMIIKKYQTGYLPISKKELSVATTYKEDYSRQTSNNRGDVNRVHHIMIDLVIPRQFLEMVPTSAEDFKIDIKNDKILFGGFTKQIIKDRDYIKQPMAVTVTINLEELADSNLVPNDTLDQPEPAARALVNFGMRDFRNFLTLVGYFTSSASSYVDQFDEEYANLGNQNDYFHIYFRQPGDPILFDFQSTLHVDVQFIQITAGDKSVEDGREIDPTVLRNRMTLEAPIVHRVAQSKELDAIREGERTTSATEQPQSPPNLPSRSRSHSRSRSDSHSLSRSRSRSASPESMRRFAFGRLLLANEGIDRTILKPLAAVHNETDRRSFSEPLQDVITYDQSNQGRFDNDTEYSDSEEEAAPPLKRRLIENEEYGPTQVEKAKSIF